MRSPDPVLPPVKGRSRGWKVVTILAIGYFLYLFGRGEFDLLVLNQRAAVTARMLGEVQTQNRSLAEKLHALATPGAGAGLPVPGEILYQVRPAGGRN